MMVSVGVVVLAFFLGGVEYPQQTAPNQQKRFDLLDALTEGRLQAEDNARLLVKRQSDADVNDIKAFSRERLETFYLIYRGRHDELYRRVKELEAQLKQCDSQQSAESSAETKN